LSNSGGPVVISSDSSSLHVALVHNVSIPVEFRSDHARPADQPAPALNLQLVSTSSSANSAQRFWYPQSPAFQNVEPGTYSLEIGSAGPAWVESARSGGVDLLSDDLTVVEGVQPAPIEVTVRDDSSSLSGVLSPADASHGTVLLVQSHGRKNQIRTTEITDGAFQFQGVPPGDSLLLALDRADSLEYTNPEVLAPFLSKAEHVTLQPRATANVNLTLLHVGK